jgi:hypothetical protein
VDSRAETVNADALARYRSSGGGFSAESARKGKSATTLLFFEYAARPGLISRRLRARLRHSRARSIGGGLPVVGSSSEGGETARGAGGVARRDALRRDGGRARG